MLQGHAYSRESLVAELDEAIEEALWGAVGSVKENTPRTCPPVETFFSPRVRLKDKLRLLLSFAKLSLSHLSSKGRA